MASEHPDHWLLPGRQIEYPARDFIAEEILHGRRESTFLVLAAVFVVTAAVLVLVGSTRVIDPASVLAVLAPDVALPFALAVPLGALPFALGALALTLVCELFGRRRGAAVFAVAVGACAALCGVMALADRLDGGAALAPALAFTSCIVVAYALYVPLFDALRWRTFGRHLWLRLIVLSLAVQIAGWAAFGAVTYALAAALPTAHVDVATISALALGAAVTTLAIIVVLTLPTALIARGLALLLRVARHDLEEDDDRDGGLELIELTRRRLPPAEIVDDSGPRRRRAAPSLPPYSSAEMQFFRDGEQLEGADS
jgi:MFS family permease